MNHRRRAHHVALLGLALVLALGTSACVYRINIQQGNFLDSEAIAQVEPGMTRSQVRFLLGTPMLEDPFHADRWEYVYYVKIGRSRRIVQKRVAVFFDGDAVARIEQQGYDDPTEKPVPAENS